MAITTPFRRNERHSWSETDAAALTVADITGIHIKPETVRTVIQETIRVHGGPEGVQHELSRRLAAGPREADRTARTLEWARRTLREVSS